MEAKTEEFKEEKSEKGKERKRYRRELESRLAEWTEQIERLRAKARVAEADLRVKYQKEIRNLDGKRDLFNRRFEELKKSSDEAWLTLKSGTEKAKSDLKQALDNALRRFKKNR